MAKVLKGTFDFEPAPIQQVPPATEGKSARDRIAMLRHLAILVLQSDMPRKEKQRRLKELQKAI